MECRLLQYKGANKLNKHNILQIFDRNWNWILLAALFFLFGIIFSVIFFGNENFFLTELTTSQKQVLSELAELILEGSALRGILLLFLNNLFTSIQMVVLGIFLGVPSLFGLFFNGAILGSLLVALGLENQPIFAFIALGILPHGVFELPAFFVSAAFGLKLGFHLIFPLPQKKRGESISFIWKEYWSVFPLIINLLFLAAVIEIVITPLLLKFVVG